ncbi:MAG: hypothetical protein IH840_15630, partial [Candidatus Heimdallarchaeota archaeon]|nr:hypothetical protein [Candidatus Heimdallarchaeota archaeon]
MIIVVAAYFLLFSSLWFFALDSANSTTTALSVYQADVGNQYDGNWIGFTSQQKSISFTVVDGEITNFKFESSFASGSVREKLSSNEVFTINSQKSYQITISEIPNVQPALDVEGVFENET